MTGLKAWGVAAAAMVMAGSAQAAPTITDGSFEDIATAKNAITNITGQAVGGWSGDGLPDVRESIYNGNVQAGCCDFTGTTPFGSQFLVLGNIAHRSFHSIESQTVTGFEAGKSYAVSLYFAVLNRTSGTDFGASLPSGIGIFVSNGTDGAGDLLADASFTSDVYGPYNFDGIPFQEVTVRFTAESDAATLSINNQSYHSDVAIDNVSLAEVAAAPEPSTWALLTLGVGLAGFALRRRRALATA